MADYTPRRIVFVAYPGVSLLDLAGPLEAFMIASAFGSAPAQPLYECIVVSSIGGPVRSADGVELVTLPMQGLDMSTIDTIVVPGAFHVDDVVLDLALIDWLRAVGAQCRRVCAVCVGSFMLGAAGLLKDRRAVTHWLHCDRLASEQPSAKVESDAIYVRDGNVWTSAGVTSGIDLALALIEDDAGKRTALSVARMLVVYLKRAGGQSQYSPLLAAQVGAKADAFTELESWIAENLRVNLGNEALAERVNMSPRNFARVYASQRGRTPAKAVEAIRLDAARRMLEETTEHIETIADRCGFSSEEQMRVTFVRSLGIPPTEYRKRF
jgi:transcriptional regulator GlxA family with amidase domain